VVPAHGTLTTETEWANELHPKDPGFHKVALEFRDAVQPHLASLFAETQAA